MKFSAAPLAGVWVIEPDQLSDERGWFARTFCIDEFAAHHLPTEVVQCNSSFNVKRGTVRGMHYQIEPHAEAKLVRAARGAIHDTVIDLRPNSPTFRQSFAVELTEVNGRMLFIPTGLAHGFQTLRDDTEVAYHMFSRFSASHARGVRWDDPAFNLSWPLEISVISAKDRQYPDFAL